MAYIAEYDELPWEARQGVATTFRYWPKVDGQNVAVTGTPSFTVHDPQGNEVQGSTAASVVDVTGDSRLDLTVNALATLDEGYQVRLLWRTTGDTVDRFDLRTFDVVLYPFGQPWTSLNDLLDLRSAAGDLLERIGIKLGYAAGDPAREQAAGLCAYNGRLALDSRIRDSVVQRREAAVSELTSASAIAQARTVYARPALILDRARLIRVERLEAMTHLYRSIAAAPEDGEDTASSLYRAFKADANMAWQQVGPLRYDGEETLAGDDQLTDLSRATYVTRVQG